MKKLLLVFFLLFTYSTVFQTLAQSGGVNLTLGFPMGEFKESVSRTGVGISGHFMFISPRPQAPFGFGVSVGYINYGSESRREAFSYTIPDVFVDVDRTNNILNFHVLFQLMFPRGDVRPYIEGLFGGSYIYTTTSIKSRDYEEVASSTNFDDFAWSYGGGGGFLIKVHAGGEDGDIGDVFLDLKTRYLLGSEAEYLKEGSVKFINNKVYYDVSRSKTDLLTAQIGVTAFFNSIWH